MINFEDMDPYCAFCDRSPVDIDYLDETALDYEEKKAELESLVLTADMSGNHWCQDHMHLYRVMSWGYRHNWPELHCEPHVIPAGEGWWLNMIAVNKNEDIGYMVEAAIEFMESEAKAS